MRLNYNDNNLALLYFQKVIHDEYNDNVIIDGKYYEYINTLYGFAHYIYRYLEYNFPIPYENENSEIDINYDIVSVSNYFSCDNKGNKLDYDCDEYLKTYNQYQRGNEYGVINKRYIDENDLPLGFENKNGIIRKTDIPVKTMSKWNIDKNIFEIDSFIASYLFGRTITPHSSREEIFYVQDLLIGKEHILEKDKGIWYSSVFNLTDIIIDFQRNMLEAYNKNNANDNKLLVTGYFDIFTESIALQNRGGERNGIHGL